MHPKPQDHPQASFPEMDKIPEPARASVEKFLQLRERLADANEAWGEAMRAMDKATREDQVALDAHIADGCSSATFDYPATKAVKAAIDVAQADRQALERLIAAAYLDAVRTLQANVKAGRATATEDIEAAHADYLEAIGQVEAARRAYLRALGLKFFYEHLAARGVALATAGYQDQLILMRVGAGSGPITRIDSSTFSAMRSDAQAHERMSGDAEHRVIW
jgi:hypothetical protein